MASQIPISLTFNGKPIEVLDELIGLRQKVLFESADRATIATAIQVFNSLKADTKVAPLKGNRKMYTIERTGLCSSWIFQNGKKSRVVRNAPRSNVDWNVSHRCRNVAGQHYSRGESVSVYKMQLFNENLNTTVYYCHAKNEKDARNYIEKIILARMLTKESGMARYAIGIAQAKVSDRPMTSAPSGSKQFRTAREAAIVRTSSGNMGSGKFFVDFYDDLRYSADALKHGDSSLDLAMKKAANKISGILRKNVLEHPFMYDLSETGSAWSPPFPEVKGVR